MARFPGFLGGEIQLSVVGRCDSDLQEVFAGFNCLRILFTGGGAPVFGRNADAGVVHSVREDLSFCSLYSVGCLSANADQEHLKTKGLVDPELGFNFASHDYELPAASRAVKNSTNDVRSLG